MRKYKQFHMAGMQRARGCQVGKEAAEAGWGKITVYVSGGPGVSGEIG